MPRLDRPYILRIRYGARDSLQSDHRFSLCQGRAIARWIDCDPPGPSTPRSGRSFKDGSAVEFRYVDPRPGAPDCISPRTQEV